MPKINPRMTTSQQAALAGTLRAGYGSGAANIGVQAKFLEAADLAGIGDAAGEGGTASIERYFLNLKNLTEQYAEAIYDPGNLSAVGKKNLGVASDANALRRALRMTSGSLDMSHLNRGAQNRIYQDYVTNVMQMQEVVKNSGIPAMSMASDSPYNRFTSYLVNPNIKAGQRNRPNVNGINEIFC